MSVSNLKTKRIAANKWFGLRWSNWLSKGEKITASVWAIPEESGLTKASESFGDNITSIKLSGGNVGKWTLTNTITTNSPLAQTEPRDLIIEVEA